MAKRIVALMGNPNVGKSTVFNEITGSQQHTGNWTGKTVDESRGHYKYKYNDYELVDLPGTYSLLSSSEEERVARDFLCFSKVDCTVIVADATNLERNLNLVLQTIEVTNKAVLLLNLCDEAKKFNITIDEKILSDELGIPVIKATARSGKGINELLEQVHLIVTGDVKPTPKCVSYVSPVEMAVRRGEKGIKQIINTDIPYRFLALRVLEDDESFNKSLRCNFDCDLSDNIDVIKAKETLERFNFVGDSLSTAITSALMHRAKSISALSVKRLPSKAELRHQRLDNILMGKYTAVPTMILIMAVVLWLTIKGSNYPSELLRGLFDDFQLWLSGVMSQWGISDAFIGATVGGVLKVLLWVVAVMLPPMTIFFPLFALLEDFGVLPRLAFNLDSGFEKCGACGKQALTTCMGYGCNAVGVTGARIIDSPRERLIAIITNSLTPCNGRFPLLIVIISMFFCSSSFASAGILLLFMVSSVVMTMVSSRFLSSTVLKGQPSTFILELPPYRKPQFFKVIWQTVKEKILLVLGRAVVVAAPAGLVIWGLANIKVSGASVLSIVANALEPVGQFIGLDGVMLLAFILGFPANEIVIPIALMIYMQTGELIDYSSSDALRSILVSNGWDATTAVCACVFSMFHFPCSTTLLTIMRETKSAKWSILSVILPLAVGIILCAVINCIF